MRTAKLHSQADMLLLGYTNDVIHRYLDSPVKDLGAQHRQVNHSYQMVKTMRTLYGVKGGYIALLHLLIDLDIVDSKFIEWRLKQVVKEYLTVKEVAERLSCSEVMVRSWIKTGTLPAIKVGKQWRITISDYDSLVKS